VQDGGVTHFHDLQEYMAIPRVEALAMAPDGTRLVAEVKRLAPDWTKFVSALWEIDPAGQRQPRRLTRSAAGESSPVFLPDGTLLFVSARPDGEAGPAEDEAGQNGDSGGEKDKPALWALPAAGGEARRIAARPGGIGGPVVASQAGAVVFTAATLPGDADGDADRRKQRSKAGVSAILHESHPIRFWDHELGPDEARLFLLRPDTGDGAEAGAGPAGARAGEPEAQAGPPGDRSTADGGGPARDLTPRPGQALVDQRAELTPDGSTVLTGWLVPDGRGGERVELAAIACATGQRRTLLGREDTDFSGPVAAPDGRTVICRGERHGSLAEPPQPTLWLVPLDGTPPRDLLAEADLWPGRPAWSPDSRTAYFPADQHGRAPVFTLDLATGSATPLTQDDAAYTHLAVAPDGAALYALRSAIGAPPTPVRIDSATGQVTRLPTPGGTLPLPGEVTEISAAAPDGTEIRGWLVLPAQARPDHPAPLLLWVHGGPYSSWNSWSWRWNPWIMAAHGYAVLLPDPALSTGYGQQHIRRGHGRWGEVTFDDVMAITDAAAARDDIDHSRTAMMGGSFGGYMANWIAGHTDRFDAIVSHASLWNFDGIVTSDQGYYFGREFGEPADQPARWAANDPSRHAAKIRTPMLVIHGDKDFRVPISNGLWLWRDLMHNQVDAKFLYYPDENHWVLTPGNATVWYETVLAFLAQHVLGEQWQRPQHV
jgi:dipeptidyl aminopeptidase/acylaminoacyl peptidase